MNKQHAISLLGGSNKSAAKAIGISQQAVSLWPDELTPAISDRVEAAYFRLKGQNISVFSPKPPQAAPAKDAINEQQMQGM